MNSEVRKSLLSAAHKKARAFARRVSPVYDALEWTWYGMGVPSIYDIEMSIHDRISTLEEGVHSCACESGGIRVEIHEEDAINEHPPRVIIKFQVEEVVTL